jgi:hypothetical protein
MNPHHNKKMIQARLRHQEIPGRPSASNAISGAQSLPLWAIILMVVVALIILVFGAMWLKNRG